MNFHHLGVACDDIAAEIPCFEALGYRQEGGMFRDPIHKVEGAFMTGPGPRLELLAPIGAVSPVRASNIITRDSKSLRSKKRWSGWRPSAESWWNLPNRASRLKAVLSRS
jgi:hypothetical protein